MFVIANGVWVALMPPFGDEPVGMAIIAVGIFIPIITLSVARMDERRYDSPELQECVAGMNRHSKKN